jgi:hypothetical protein
MTLAYRPVRAAGSGDQVVDPKLPERVTIFYRPVDRFSLRFEGGLPRQLLRVRLVRPEGRIPAWPTTACSGRHRLAPKAVVRKVTRDVNEDVRPSAD